MSRRDMTFGFQQHGVRKPHQVPQNHIDEKLSRLRRESGILCSFEKWHEIVTRVSKRCSRGVTSTSARAWGTRACGAQCPSLRVTSAITRKTLTINLTPRTVPASKPLCRRAHLPVGAGSRAGMLRGMPQRPPVRDTARDACPTHACRCTHLTG